MRTDVDGQAETKAIPARVRAEVMDRDQSICRVCGSYAEHPAIHHVEYRSEGGLHVVENLITTHWMYAPRCHERVHDNKRLWQPILKQVASTPGVTAFQLLRWQRAEAARAARSAGPPAA